MRILIFTIGSAGDVFPQIALGLELQRRGHRITLMTGGHYETAVRKAGLDFSAMFSEADFNKIVEHPDLYHPRRTTQCLQSDSHLPLRSLRHRVLNSKEIDSHR